MSYFEIINKIQQLPKYREYTCKKCGHIQRTYILEIQSYCEKCGSRCKLRAYSAQGSEVEDVIDIVLEWIGSGDEFKDAMKWKKILDSTTE